MAQLISQTIYYPQRNRSGRHIVDHHFCFLHSTKTEIDRATCLHVRDEMTSNPVILLIVVHGLFCPLTSARGISSSFDHSNPQMYVENMSAELFPSALRISFKENLLLRLTS
jgi:hypothetical protein